MIVESLSEMMLQTALLAQDTVAAGGGEAVAATSETVVTEDDVAGRITMALVVLLASVIIPFVLGAFIASALKMKEYGGRFGFILFALWLGLMPFVQQLSGGKPLSEAIRLGIDLAGGTNLIYQVDTEQAEKLDKEIDAATMDRMVGAIGRRINPSGTEEVTVRRVGKDRIEVIVPGADNDKTESIKSSITRLGSLEFAVAANPQEHPAIISQAQRLTAVQRDVKNDDGQTIAMWRPITAGREGEVGLDQYTVTRPFGEGEEAGVEILLVVNPREDRRLTGRLLKRAYETIADTGSVVGFTFNERGGLLMQQLTRQYQPKEGSGYRNRLAITLDDKLYSAPTINDVIGANGQISGDFDSKELTELIGVLNAGALEVPLVQTPVSEFSVSPLLGIDVQQKGKMAIMIAAGGVFIFMLVFYRTAGVVADICLAMNIIMVLGVMSLIQATFTLPGLAGLVLTIGMAVDANVLIFERMREEKSKGSSLRLAIQQGFAKAFSTIVDANVTTLIVAIVLFQIGSDQVRGFAVTLFIGIVMSMFTALYVGKTFFEVLEKKRLIKDINMMSIVPKTDIQFLSGRGIATVVSLILIVGGMAAFFTRGQDNLDIDFRGGTMVTFRTEGETPDVDAARSALTPNFESGMSLEQLTVTDPDGTDATLYRLRTTDTDQVAVSAGVAKSFDGTEFKLIEQIATFADVESADDDGLTSSATVKSPMSPTLLRNLLVKALSEIEGGSYEPTDNFVTVTPTGEQADDSKATAFAIETTPDVAAEDLQAAFATVNADFESSPFFDEVNSFDAAVAGETQQYAIVAMVVSLVAIVAYIWIRFQSITFGLAAVAALVHDVLVVMGAVAIAGFLSQTPVGSILLLNDFKINLPMIAAFLTIVGYSLNDTIVVFDRIREVRGKRPTLDTEIVNTSLNGTLSRTLLTSLTTLIVVLILYVLGGEGIHGFAFCLVLGVLVGTYSSIYVASPVLLWLMDRERKSATARKNGPAGNSRDVVATKS